MWSFSDWSVEWPSTKEKRKFLLCPLSKVETTFPHQGSLISKRVLISSPKSNELGERWITPEITVQSGADHSGECQICGASILYDRWIFREIYFTTFCSGSLGSDLASMQGYRLREGYIVRPALLSWLFSLILAFHCWAWQFVHDAPRKRASPEYWYALLGDTRTIVDSRILLWCVLLACTVRFIHKFDNRSVCFTLCCISCYLYVRFLLLQPAQPLPRSLNI